MKFGRNVFETRTSTGSGLYSFMGSCFAQIYGQIAFVSLWALSKPNLEALWQIKRERGSLPVDVRRSKTPLLKLPNGLNLRGCSHEKTGTGASFIPG